MRLSSALGGLALSGAACFAYGALVEVKSFRVRRVRVPVLPAGAEPIRVLHLSDIHLLAGQRSKREFVAALAGLEPDLVINTGDNLSSAAALEPLRADLGRLLAVPGAFVFGSNDYTAPRPGNPLRYLAHSTTRDGIGEDREALPSDALREALSSQGWIDLTGHRGICSVRGLRIELRGTDDAHLGLDDYSTVAGPPSDGVDLSLGVTHAPYARVLDGMTADRVPLIFAGHTHGGQVCVPGWGALTTNCDLPVHQAKGLSRHHVGERTSWLHVSAGLGSSPFAPYRFACPPEATLLTLTAGSNG